MSNTTFVGPVRSENGFLQQDPETGEWVPISGGGGGTEPLSGNSPLLITTDSNTGVINYYNGVDVPPGSSPGTAVGNMQITTPSSVYAFQAQNPTMVIDANGLITSISAASAAGENIFTVATKITTTTSGSHIIANLNDPNLLPLLSGSRITAIHLRTAGPTYPNIAVTIKWYAPAGSQYAVTSGMLISSLIGGTQMYAWGTSGFNLWPVTNDLYGYSLDGGSIRIEPTVGTIWNGAREVYAAVIFAKDN